MKKILITGMDSYVGTAFENYMQQYNKDYQIDVIDMKNPNWVKYDFSKYDTVFHVAGLAHSTPKKKDMDLYYKVNTDLAFNTAKKAKNDGVKQFIFMSSLIVYGNDISSKKTVITTNSKLNPDNFYGDSKKRAEEQICTLKEENFNIAIIRSPMIYGPKSKGNYRLLSKFAKITPIFPNFDNNRSIIFINNLTEFIRLLIDNCDSGIFLPQNKEIVSSTELVKIIAETKRNKIFFTNIFNPIIRCLIKQKYINKVFGSLLIDMELSRYKSDYQIFTLEQSIKITEETV